MKHLIAVALIITSTSIWSQTDSLKQHSKQNEEVTAVINTLFTGMRLGDSSIVAAVFHKDARLMTTYTSKNGEATLQKDDISGFFKAIGTPHKEIWDERISNVEIRIDDNLAQAWMDYSFYVDDTFSHCGVNAFQFVRLDDQWQIISIADTRRRTKCTEE